MKTTHNSRRLIGMLVLAGGLLTGCQGPGGRSADEYFRYYENPYPRPWNLAVTIFRNQSGSETLSEVAVTDEFYTELQLVEGGLHVVPVNRVLAAMSELGLSRVENPDDAAKLAERLDVDGVIVGTITRYDPYDPPLAGMAVQLYGRPVREETPAELDPWQLSRSGQPFALTRDGLIRPQAMVVRIFDASADEVIDRMRRFARDRIEESSPYGWEKVKTGRYFLRFVSHEMIGELLAQEKNRLVAEEAQETEPNDG